jgi:hypothetical protein
VNFVDLVTGLSLGLMLITIYHGPNTVRLLVFVLGGLTFGLPILLPTHLVNWLAFVSRVLIAVACYLYLRSHRKIR